MKRIDNNNNNHLHAEVIIGAIINNKKRELTIEHYIIFVSLSGNLGICADCARAAFGHDNGCGFV